MKLAGHDRYDYSPLRGRPNYTWPQGKRLAVYFALNLEHFSFGEGLGAELSPGGPQPDVLNFAWRDYGNRVGAWYVLDAFDALDLPMAALVNSAMYDYAPELVAACRTRGDEIVAHGRTNAERQGHLDEAAELALIADATARITKEEGRTPEGWLGPWISHSHRTPDLLAEADYRYLLDWCMDDQPIWFSLPRWQAHHGDALPAGSERHPGHRRAQDGRVAVRRPDHRSIRRNARAQPDATAGHGRGTARLHRRPAASAKTSQARTPPHSIAARGDLAHHTGRHRASLHVVAGWSCSINLRHDG
jgi:hypothetical protein